MHDWHRVGSGSLTPLTPISMQDIKAHMLTPNGVGVDTSLQYQQGKSLFFSSYHQTTSFSLFSFYFELAVWFCAPRHLFTCNLQFDCTTKQNSSYTKIDHFYFVLAGLFEWGLLLLLLLLFYYFIFSKRNLCIRNDCMFALFICFVSIFRLESLDFPSLGGPLAERFVYVVVVLFIRRHRWSFGLHCRYWRLSR